VSQAIRSRADETRRGFTFLRPDGSEQHYSWRALSDEIDRRGQRLLDRGLERGDRLALILPEAEDFVLTFLSALAVGVVPVPMYPPLSFGKLDAYIETAERILSTSKARAIITSQRVQSVLWSLVDRVETLKEIETVAALEGPARGGRPDLDLVGMDDLAFLQFTSGSTSTPKGVMVTHGNLVANMHGIMIEGTRRDKGVSWLPLYHDMGLIGFVLAPAWSGVPVVFMNTMDFIKRPSRWMQAIHDHRGTITFAPNFAYALAVKRTRESKLDELDLSCLKALGCGAEPNHPDTLGAFLDYFEPTGLRREALLPCYGMAESTLAITFVGLDEQMHVDSVDSEVYQRDGVAEPLEEADDDEQTPTRFVSCGRPFPGHEVLVVDEEGAPLPDRQIGEIIVRGPSVAKGYFYESEKTSETFTERGLRTGDLGYMVDGELFVTGRIKDLIILNGRNYDPQSIEWDVAEVPGVRKGNVVAFSVPGERTEGLVLVAETREEDHEELERTIRRKVRETTFLDPQDVVLLGPGMLPKTTSGKLQRSRARQLYLEDALEEEGVRTLGAEGETLTVARHLASSALSRVRHEVKKNGVRHSVSKGAKGVREGVKQGVKKGVSRGAKAVISKLTDRGR
jgi:fatty-acyl-CoA synthase